MNILGILPLERRECEPRQVVEANVLAKDAGEHGVARVVVHIFRERGRHFEHGGFGLFEDAVETAQDNEGKDNLAILGLLEIAAKKLGDGPDETAQALDVVLAHYPSLPFSRSGCVVKPSSARAVTGASDPKSSATPERIPLTKRIPFTNGYPF